MLRALVLMTLVPFLVPFLASCRLFYDPGDFDLGAGNPDGGSGDGGVVGSCEDWSPLNFDPCAVESIGVFEIGSSEAYRVDTQGGALIDPEGRETPLPDNVVIQETGVEVFVLLADRITIPPGASVTAVGKLPLIVASYSTIELRGLIDAGLAPESMPGPEPGGAACHPASAGEVITRDGGGGAGGSLAALGGIGGGGNEGFDGGPGEPGDALKFSRFLRGGCPGSRGGGLQGGAGAPGGGGVQVSAQTDLILGPQARILASGAGGQGGGNTMNHGGGGGGGSGGMIILDSPVITSDEPTSVVAANGGGGGGGGDVNTAGDVGEAGPPAMRAAMGGTGNAPGGTGGHGDAAHQTGGRGGAYNDAGGGGGGGSAGLIVIRSGSDLDWIISPAPTDETGAPRSP